MATSLEKRLGYNPILLDGASIVLNYSSQGKKGKDLTQVAFGELLKDIGVDEATRHALLASGGEITNAVKGYLDYYNNQLADSTMTEIAELYGSKIREYGGKNAQVAIDDLSKLGDKKYNSILKEFKLAEIAIEKAELEGDEKSKETAEKIIEKYQKVLDTINLARSYCSENLRTKVEKEYRKKMTESMYPEPKVA